MTHLKKSLPPKELNKIKASLAVSKEAAAKVYADHFDLPTTLAIWQVSSTAATAEKVFENGAALLPKSVIADITLPRVSNYRNILWIIDRAIGWGKDYYTSSLLRDVDFQHHQSTNGLWNPELGRWERWGARDQDGWLKPTINDPKMKSVSQPRVSPRTFERIKKRLIDMGLIEETRKDFPRGRPIWLKPTPELSRILFEPGYWDQVRGKYAPLTPKKAPPKDKKKPRGNSAHHHDNADLYRQAIKGELPDLTDAMKKTIWVRLTKPHIASEKYTMKPFLEQGSPRYFALQKALWPK